MSMNEGILQSGAFVIDGEHNLTRLLSGIAKCGLQFTAAYAQLRDPYEEGYSLLNWVALGFCYSYATVSIFPSCLRRS